MRSIANWPGPTGPGPGGVRATFENDSIAFAARALLSAFVVVNEDTNVACRSISDLLAMVVQRRSLPGLLERVGGLERLADAEAIEIAAHLEGRNLDARQLNAAFGEGAMSSVLVDLAFAAQPRKKEESFPPAALRQARAIAAAFELGRRAEIERAKPSAAMSSAEQVAAWAGPRIAQLSHEELWILALDGRGRLRAARMLAQGGLHGAGVRATDPLRAALRVNASAFVLVHNHPSGDPTPSADDIESTSHLALAAQLVGLVLLDHVVVTANGGYASVPFSLTNEKKAG